MRVNLALPESHAQLIAEVEQLRTQSKSVKGYGYSVSWTERKHRLHQRNEYPTKVYFETLEDVARLLGKLQELQRFQEAITELRSRLPCLEDWIKKSGAKLSGCVDAIPDLILLTEYRLQNPHPGVTYGKFPSPCQRSDWKQIVRFWQSVGMNTFPMSIMGPVRETLSSDLDFVSRNEWSRCGYWIGSYNKSSSKTFVENIGDSSKSISWARLFNGDCTRRSGGHSFLRRGIRTHGGARQSGKSVRGRASVRTKICYYQAAHVGRGSLSQPSFFNGIVETTIGGRALVLKN